MADEKKSPPGGVYTAMSPEQAEELMGKGTLQVTPKPRTIAETFTAENLEKFILGEITWGQLQGITVEETYSIAEYAYQQYQQGRFFEAAKLFEALVIFNPYDAYFHSMLGACYQMLDNKDLALIEYTSAIELDPNQIQARVNRAELRLQKGEFEPALDDLQRAVELDPKGDDPAGVRARALAAATAQAIESLTEMIRNKKKP